MSKKILFLKTIFQYILDYLSSFNLCSAKGINAINQMNTIWFFLVFFCSMIFLFFTSLIHQVLYLVMLLLAILDAFLKTFEFFLSLRIALEWFPAFNPYNFKASSALIRITNPFLKTTEKLLPRLFGYNVSAFFSFFLISFLMMILSDFRQRLFLIRSQIPYIFDFILRYKSLA